MTFPRKSWKPYYVDLKFEILHDSLVDFVALHMLVYRKSFKSTLKWVPLNLRGMVRNTNWITVGEFTDLELVVNERILTYEAWSRNIYKREYRRLLQELGEK